ncbi:MULTISPECIES: hypothetical protein [unclassified Streptomyces]|uniref:hypothetical protein n=1 Tax=unclassified Streptomyces TaxID=2593676 RepID=UPI0036F78B13
MSALIGTGGVLIGVGIGLVGPLVSARIQARGASEQASATVAAAEHAARSQYRAVMDEQARQARRNVYSGFLDAVRELEQGIRTRPEQENLEAERVLNEALAQVEIEGPDEVQEAAISVRRELTAWHFARLLADRLAQDVAALGRPDPSWSERQRTAARELSAAISAAEVVIADARAQGAFQEWQQWRLLLVANSFQAPFRGRELMERFSGYTWPSPEVTAAFDAALTRVQNGAMAAHGAGVFATAAPTLLDSLVRSGRVLPQGGAGISGWRPLEEAMQRFRLAARQALHDMPEL